MTPQQPPLFEGEPEHCSLCGDAGHTHDDHWLFQHEPVKALQARVRELERVYEPKDDDLPEFVTGTQVEQLRTIARDGHAPEEVLTALRLAMRFYDLTRKAWEGTREEVSGLEYQIEELEAELRKYEPSDGVMHQRLAAYEAIREAATLLQAAPLKEDVDDLASGNARRHYKTAIAAWLALPVVSQARKAVKT